MNIMLIDPPSLEGHAWEAEEKKMPTPNMGLLYLATYIRNKTNATVKIIDMAAENIDFSNLKKRIKKEKPDLIGLSSKTFNILSAYKIANLVKKNFSDIVVILGGAHATALPEMTLNECPEIDAVVIREGERTLLEIVERMQNGYHEKNDLFQNLNGTAYKNINEEVVINEERDLIADLDLLPQPDLSFVNYKKNYIKVYNPNKKTFQHVYPVFASRGCPFNCTFCMPLLTRKYRVRKTDEVIKEIKSLNETHGVERIYFEDSLFGANKQWFVELCNKYIENGLHDRVQWGFETRIDRVDYEMFQLAKQAGCIYTFFGIESGDEEVLKKANKGYTVELIKKIVKEAKRAGIDQINASFILGLPYENKVTIQKTIELIKDLPFDSASLNILDVYPGTQIFEMVDRGIGGLRWINGKRFNWAEYKRQEPMVEVNDLDADYLLKTLKEGREIIKEKRTRNKKELIEWQKAFEQEYGGKSANWHLERFIFYWKSDKKRLAQIIADYLIHDMVGLVKNTYRVINAYAKKQVAGKMD